MLVDYLEAEGSLAEFWSIETPRTTIARITAYRRRRGWLAWQTAALGRFSWKEYGGSIPPLRMMMGLPAPRQEAQSNDDIAAAMMSLVSMTAGGKAAH